MAEKKKPVSTKKPATKSTDSASSKKPVTKSIEKVTDDKFTTLEKQAAAKGTKKPVEKKQIETPKNAESKSTTSKEVSKPSSNMTKESKKVENTFQVNDFENKKKQKKKSNKQHEDRKLVLAVGKNVPFAYAEAYKSLRTNLNFIASTEDVKTIVVTSAIPKESKSNVAVNLAITLASEGKKVILVDCDLRKPALNHYLKMGRHRQGLTDVLVGNVSLSEAIVKFKDVKINVLAAGSVPPNPSELLSQSKMQDIIDILKANYDYVIMDAPPVSVVTDAAILSHYADGVILVVRSKFAPIESIQLAKHKLESVNARILGVVITRYNVKKSSKSSAYTYTYEYEYGNG